MQEFQSGTNPRDPASVLRISSTATGGGTFVLRFPSVSGKFYRVEYADDPSSDPWQILSNNIAGTGSIVQINDSVPVGLTERFYRVRALP